MEFWKELKKGDDHFEATKHDVAVAVCGRHYVFDAQSANGQPLDPKPPACQLKTDPQIRPRRAARARHRHRRGRTGRQGNRARCGWSIRTARSIPPSIIASAEVSRPDALTRRWSSARRFPIPRWNANGALSASTATALVLRSGSGPPKVTPRKPKRRASGQIQQRAQAASAVWPAARMQSEKFVAIVGTFGQKDTAAPAASQATEIGRNVAMTPPPRSRLRSSQPSRPAMPPPQSCDREDFGDQDLGDQDFGDKDFGRQKPGPASLQPSQFRQASGGAASQAGPCPARPHVSRPATEFNGALIAPRRSNMALVTKRKCSFLFRIIISSLLDRDSSRSRRLAQSAERRRRNPVFDELLVAFAPIQRS